MEKYFCNYEQALALKELGFDEPCIAYYSTQDVFKGQFKLATSNCQLDLMTQAPLKSQVFEWVRGRHKLASFIWYNSLCEKWRFDEIMCLKTGDTLVDSDEQFNTYEEAESTAIDKLIKLIKDENSNVRP